MSTIKISITTDPEGKIKIGAIQSISIKEDGSSPKLEVSRMRIDRLKIGKIFADDDCLVKSQRYPFHILIEDESETQIIKTEIHNVWISSIETSYKTGEWMLAEGVKMDAESVSTTVNITSTEND